MPHSSRKEHDSKDRTSQRSPGTEQQSLVSGHAPKYTVHGKYRDGSQIPFYDHPNHVAYGWQQMTVLPDVFNLGRGSPADPLRSPWTRPHTWPVEQQDGGNKAEPSGFNLHPEHRQGPRRPRPLPLPGGGVHQRYEARQNFQPFVDPVAAERDDVGTGANEDRDRPSPSMLSSRNANQKFRSDRSQGPPMKLTEIRPGLSRLRSKSLIVDGLETTQQARGEAEYMSPLAEEPAPLTFRKNHADRAQSASNSSHSRKSTTVKVRELKGPENEEMESLMAAITEQISAFTVEPNHQFEHRSAVPRPLNLDAIDAAKEKRRLAGTEPESSSKAGWCAQNQGKGASVDSFAPSTS